MFGQEHDLHGRQVIAVVFLGEAVPLVLGVDGPNGAAALAADGKVYSLRLNKPTLAELTVLGKDGFELVATGAALSRYNMLDVQVDDEARV